jgi:hypothetical protein
MIVVEEGKGRSHRENEEKIGGKGETSRLPFRSSCCAGERSEALGRTGKRILQSRTSVSDASPSCARLGRRRRRRRRGTHHLLLVETVRDVAEVDGSGAGNHLRPGSPAGPLSRPLLALCRFLASVLLVVVVLADGVLVEMILYHHVVTVVVLVIVAFVVRAFKGDKILQSLGLLFFCGLALDLFLIAGIAVIIFILSGLSEILANCPKIKMNC